MTVLFILAGGGGVVISNVVPMCMTVIDVVIHFTFGLHVKVELKCGIRRKR